MLKSLRLNRTLLSFLLTCFFATASGQDWVSSAINRSQAVRIAAPDFRPADNHPQTARLNSIFNQTLWNDLDNSGMFEMVSKSFYPLETPKSPDDSNLSTWANSPVNASAVVFGELGITNQSMAVQGWLVDARNPAQNRILQEQYQENATADDARLIAHRLADEIVNRIGGIPGVSQSRIFFVSSRTGHDEVWVMDYDGFDQHPLTHLNSSVQTPRASPDGSRVIFSSKTEDSWRILMYAMNLGRLVPFPRFAGDNDSPTWSSDGARIAFSSSMRGGDREIFSVGASGMEAKRLTTFRGADISPVFNPRTNAQIAWATKRNGLPQIFIMKADGSDVQQITNAGSATSPAWSPNGMLLVFSWIRHYQPGSPGEQDLYLMDLTSHQFAQVTHDAGQNDFPSWSPDGRHIVFQSNRSGSEQIWTMLADGTHQQRLTREGKNMQPNWSYK